MSSTSDFNATLYDEIITHIKRFFQFSSSEGEIPTVCGTNSEADFVDLIGSPLQNLPLMKMEI